MLCPAYHILIILSSQPISFAMEISFIAFVDGRLVDGIVVTVLMATIACYRHCSSYKKTFALSYSLWMHMTLKGATSRMKTLDIPLLTDAGVMLECTEA